MRTCATWCTPSSAARSASARTSSSGWRHAGNCMISCRALDSYRDMGSSGCLRRRRMIPVRRFVLAFACAACGGGSSRLALALDGTVYGQSVAAVDAVSKVQTPFQSGSFADIFISNEPDVCGVISAARLATNRQAIRIALATRTDAGVSAPTAPGTYPVYSRSVEGPTRGNRATISYELHDASCKKVRTADGISG